jgi:hypothetical protein
MRCADDACSGRSGHFVDVLPAGDYVAVVKAKRADMVGRFQLKYEHADANGARIIGGPGVYLGNTTSSGDDVQACSEYSEPGFGSGPDDVYILASCNAPVTASTCGTSTFHSVIELHSSRFSEYEPTAQCSGTGTGQCQADPLGATVSTYSLGSGLMFLTVDGERADDAGEYQLSVAY